MGELSVDCVQGGAAAVSTFCESLCAHTWLCVRFGRAYVLAELDVDAADEFNRSTGPTQVILQSHLTMNWEALAKPVSRIRQSRRRTRTEFQQRAAKLAKHGLTDCHAA